MPSLQSTDSNTLIGRASLFFSLLFSKFRFMFYNFDYFCCFAFGFMQILVNFPICCSSLWVFSNCWIVLLYPRYLLSCKEFDHLLACFGHCMKQLNLKFDTWTVGFESIVWSHKKIAPIKKPEYDDRMLNNPKQIASPGEVVIGRFRYFTSP